MDFSLEENRRINSTPKSTERSEFRNFAAKIHCKDLHLKEKDSSSLTIRKKNIQCPARQAVQRSSLARKLQQG